jgi:glutamate N-acetyltransferase/amino-acid N-acetyltransferase
MATFAKPVADRSFNQVTVDGDSSTNDTFLVLANGAAGNAPIRAGTAEAEALEAAIVGIARELARSIARDGEGATKMIAVRVRGAESDSEARTAARAVASSSLVKTAVHGGDPNWGRIVCALGYSGAELALDKLHLSIGGLVVFERGAGVDVDLAAVRRAFEQPEIEIVATLGLADGQAEAWGCDLSEEYVRINAEYTT